MSKLNASRIINLNYNKNTMRINDECFEFGGESTLVSLRNGGGKTVMVQMLMAPFVSGNYRDLKDRKFRSYFTSTSPTYIMTEWLLDNNSGYVLIGFAVRKKPASADEEDTEDLEIIAFIHEYKSGNEHDIHSIEVINKTDTGFTVKPMSEAKKIMEQIKSNRSFSFDYYELSNANQRKRYYDKLREYNINQKEWQSIIRKINMKESGLSELFNEAKTIPALIKEWFLPAVEERLNDKENRIRKFQEILNKYIVYLKENESKLKLREGIEAFRGYSDELLGLSEELELVQKDKKLVENDIANLYSFIILHLQKLEGGKNRLSLIKERLGEELNDIEYERLSFEYYKLLEEMEKHEEEAEYISQEIKRLETQKNSVSRERGTLIAAKFYEEYKNTSREVQTIENKLANAKKADEDKKLELDKVGYTLNIKYASKVAQDEEEYKLKEDEISARDKEISGKEKFAEDLNSEANDIEKAIQGSNFLIKGFENAEDDFRGKYKSYNIHRNMMGEYEEAHIRLYEQDTAKREKKLASELQTLSSKIEASEVELEKNRNDIASIEKSLPLKDYELNQQERKLKELKEGCSEIKNILRYCNIGEDKLFQKNYILGELNKSIKQIAEEMSLLSKEKDTLKAEQNMYETGNNIKLPEDFEKKLKEQDINVLVGLKWLKEQPISFEKKLELIKKNPFLPYSIIMSSHKIERLRNSDMKVFTSIPIPVVEQESLDKDNEIKVVNNLYTISNFNFYVSFNEKLLNEEELKKIVEEIRKFIESNRDIIDNKREELDKLYNDRQVVLNFDVKQKDLVDLEEQIKELNEEILNLNDQKRSIGKANRELSAALQILNKNKDMLNTTYSELKNESDSFQALKHKYEEYGIHLKKNILSKEAKGKKIRERQALLEGLKKLRGEIDILRSELLNIGNTYYKDKGNLSKYQSFITGEPITGDIEDLEAKFEALKLKLGAEALEYQSWYESLNKRYNEVVEDLKKTEREYGLSEEDYINKAYDKLREESLQKLVVEIGNKIADEKKKLNEEEKTLVRLSERQDIQLENIRKSSNEELPKSKELIANTDFIGRKKLKEAEINECNSRLDEISNHKEILFRNQYKLSGFSELLILDVKELSIPYEEIDSFTNKLMKDHKTVSKSEEDKKSLLESKFVYFSTNFEFRTEEYFKNTIDTLMTIKFSPSDVKSTLKTIYEVHEKTLHQLQSDLNEISKEERAIVNSLLDYVKEIYDGMNKIDDNSSLNINGRYYQMLEIIQPEWSEESYLIVMRDYIQRVVEDCKKILSIGSSIDDILAKEITTSRLYDSIVHISGVNIKLYKIETFRVVRISWNEVAENSGGEGFVSAFIVLVSLLSYMRKEEDSIISTKEQGKVLLMDNPFAQTNAEHLLKPLMDIAKKYNTQLICFSGLGGDSIYNRFDNIYVLNLLDSKINPGLQTLESEHKKGEEITQVTSTRFLMKYERIEQQRLF
jgi:hypothetical protein